MKDLWEEEREAHLHYLERRVQQAKEEGLESSIALALEMLQRNYKEEDVTRTNELICSLAEMMKIFNPTAHALLITASGLLQTAWSGNLVPKTK